MIQNADDTAATYVKILLFKDKLVFKHNGKRQFSITDAREQTGEIGDINSITSVVCSTKEDGVSVYWNTDLKPTPNLPIVCTSSSKNSLVY